MYKLLEKHDKELGVQIHRVNTVTNKTKLLNTQFVQIAGENIYESKQADEEIKLFGRYL